MAKVFGYIFVLLATVFGHSLISWPRHLAASCFYGFGSWPHVGLFLQYLATFCLMANVFGLILFYGHCSWSHFVLWSRYVAESGVMATVCTKK